MGLDKQIVFHPLRRQDLQQPLSGHETLTALRHSADSLDK